MIRDNIKNENYFITLINEREKATDKRILKLSQGLIKPDRITKVNLNLLSTFIDIIKTKYSLGIAIEELKIDYSKCVDFISKHWANNVNFIGAYNEKLNQYSLDRYDEMLLLLSLGFLLDVPLREFEILVNVIDKDKVKDELYEFIISSRLPNRPVLIQESYKYGWKLYIRLKEAIKTNDKTQSINLIKTFLEKDWYKEHKNARLYNSHKSKHNTYFGYWSFETAAVVAILNLDDSNFRDNQYYPKDLVDYYRNTPLVVG